MTRRTTTEILAPAGGWDSLTAAVRCGADAVYLGGKTLNARRNAQGFSDEELREAAVYCRARGVKLYLTLNTLAFDSELPAALELLRIACEAGVSGVIVQDLAMARLAREHAPALPLHASTQMSVHNLHGARLLEQLGFSRVVLAREMSREEIAEIRAGSQLELECFVHGALCMCVSGQCYLSAMLGGRSGNRGLCAQPCRLPFRSGSREHALSLKDLSLVERAKELADMGVSALKIEGRMKRPEYVAAAVTACRRSLDGKPPDMEELQAVFSRSGFTDGYFTGNRGDHMFGARRKEDVTGAAPVLGHLAGLYKDERPRIAVDFHLELRQGQPALLRATDRDGAAASVTGQAPEAARTAPTTPKRAAAALGKTGGTYFFAGEIRADIDDGLILPASQLNALRRSALEALDAQRSAPAPIPFASVPLTLPPEPKWESARKPLLRARLNRREQWSDFLAREADQITLPPEELLRLPDDLPGEFWSKLLVEIPPMAFDRQDELLELLARCKDRGVTSASVGSLGSLAMGWELGFTLHGDYGLNLTNSLALEEVRLLGLHTATLSLELERSKIASLGGSLPRGILAYGHLPLMATRNCPAGTCGGNCGGSGGCPELTDRKGKRFFLTCRWRVAYLHNPVPLFLADRLGEFPVDFFTLYFTREPAEQCLETLRLYRDRRGRPEEWDEITRGLYYRGVL